MLRQWYLERSRHPRPVEGEEAAPPHDLGGDRIQVPGELLHRDGLASANPLHEAEVRGGEEAQVLTVLEVDALEALGDHQPQARAIFGVGARFPTGPLAPALAGHANAEAAPAHAMFRDGEAFPAFETHVREVPQAAVEVVADPGGGDLVGADLVPQGQRRLKGEVRPAELLPDLAGVF